MLQSPLQSKLKLGFCSESSAKVEFFFWGKMSGSETGLMAASRESSMPFTMALHHQQQHNQPPSPPQTQQQQQQQSSPPPPQQYQHNSAGGGNPGLNMNMPVTMTGSEPVKKRRGRPRKYGPELGLVPGAPTFTQAQTSGGGSGEGGSSTQKRMRGRPRGSSNRKKLQALGNLYLYYIFFLFCLFWNLLPHVIWWLGSSLSAAIN